MTRNIKFLIIAALAGILFSACAKEKSESDRSIQKRILEAYLNVNYPDKNYTITSSGLVILDHQEGTGSKPEKYGAAYIMSSVKSLEGNYESTNYKDLADTLGTYDPTKYYGPTLAEIGYGKITKGMQEALLMMREGGKMKIIISPELSSYDAESTAPGYTVETSTGSSINRIYEVELKHAISDIFKFQRDSLESFRDIHYPGLDSIADGYYFKKLSGTCKDTIEKSTSVDVWYVGKLLDGYVFDTNIEDTAKKYRIYNPSGTYTALSVNMKSTYKEMTSGESEDGDGYVGGFARALKSMTYGDRAVTFFNSNWGYGSDGSESDGVGVPPFAMMFFELYIAPQN